MDTSLGFLICSLSFLYFCSTVSSDNSTDEFKDFYFGLLVSPKISLNKEREIEIYWNHAKYCQGDKIGLYTEKPRNGLQPIFTIQVNQKKGIIKTGLKADFIPTANLNFTRQCLKFHIAWLRNGSILKENCLKTEPTWMDDMRCSLGSQTMTSIFLPGTHNSASYQKPASLLQNIFYNKFVITQDEDILGQLIYGARYLDIRVCYRPSKNIKWWGCHGPFNVVPLQTIIDDVKIFLNNTNEIVIFDVQEFSSEFEEDPTVHNLLIQFLRKEFAEYASPYLGWHKTLNEIWALNKKLIIGYDHKDFMLNHDILWPRVTHQWGNVQSIDDLYTFLNKVEKAALGRLEFVPRSAMAELTPTTWYVFKNILGGLRDMTEEVNPLVTMWYNEIWQHSANVVSVDFIKDSGIVDAALKWNSKRFKNSC